MIAAAHVIFDGSNDTRDLAEILSHLQNKIPFPCSLTEWQGYSMVIPQIRVETHVPLTIQIDDDPEYVPEEIQELAAEAVGILSIEDVEKLRRCRVRLDIMSANPPRIEETDESISLYAETDLDPADDDVQRVLSALANFMRGYVFDCVNGKWLLLN